MVSALFLLSYLEFRNIGLTRAKLQTRGHTIRAWLSVGHLQHPNEVQCDPGPGNINVKYLHFHFLPRAQLQAPSLLGFREFGLGYVSYGNQPCFAHAYIHKNSKQSGILDSACENCPNLQILQADYASLEIRFIKIYKGKKDS